MYILSFNKPLSADLVNDPSDWETIHQGLYKFVGSEDMALCEVFDFIRRARLKFPNEKAVLCISSTVQSFDFLQMNIDDVHSS